jgi:hypothetical protein
MKQTKKIMGITMLIIAAYLWYRRSDALTHPEFYGELIVPIVLTIVGIFLVLHNPKLKEK